MLKCLEEIVNELPETKLGLMNGQPNQIAMSSEASPQAKAIGSRVAIAIACWALSSVGALMALMAFVSTVVVAPLKMPLEQVFFGLAFYSGIAIALAWISLAVMTFAWVNERRVAWYWPVFGGLAGLFGSVVFAVLLPFYLSCVGLGMYLLYFHLVGPTENAASQEKT